MRIKKLNVVTSSEGTTTMAKKRKGIVHKLKAVKKKAFAMDLEEEYKSIKALHALLGREIKLTDIEKFTFQIYKDYVHLVSHALNVNKEIPNNMLIAVYKIYPSVLTDFLFNNGAQSAEYHAEYQHKVKPTVKPNGPMHWIRDGQGFWKQVPVGA